MNYLGMKISVVGPVKITRTKLVEVKSKVGPRRVRKQKIKVFDGWQELIEDGRVFHFVQDDSIHMNSTTYDALVKAIKAEQKKAFGIPSEFLGLGMRGAI